MGDNELLALLIIVQGFVALVGPHLPIQGVSWPAQIATTAGTTSPGIWDSIVWVWNSISFLFSLMTFQVAGCPAFISAIFTFMGVMTGWLIIKLIRGTGG